CLSIVILFFFFFQAEDGIRARNVTGVQTCALPISPINARWAKYTGLRMSMINDFNQKIKYQLQKQGFNNIVDLTNDGKEPYFMRSEERRVGKEGSTRRAVCHARKNITKNKSSEPRP